MPTSLSLPETVALAQRVLDENKVTPTSKRMAAALTPRVVRWYASAGLLDPPGLEGHTAVYGRRHLLQLLYVRQAQATGASLDAIRTSLAALTTEDLEKSPLDLSLVPDDLIEVSPRKEPSFWERQPADAPDADAALTPRATLLHISVAASQHHPSPVLEYLVRLGAVAISLDHEPTPDEIRTLASAAGPLLSVLTHSSTPTNRSTP